MADPIVPAVPVVPATLAVSPTGVPLVSAKLAPYFVGLGTLALTVDGFAKSGVFGSSSSIVDNAAMLVFALCALLAGATPGLRTQAAQAAGTAAATNPGPTLNS